MKPKKKSHVMWVHVDGPGKGYTKEVAGADLTVSEHRPMKPCYAPLYKRSLYVDSKPVECSEGTDKFCAVCLHEENGGTWEDCPYGGKYEEKKP